MNHAIASQASLAHRAESASRRRFLACGVAVAGAALAGPALARPAFDAARQSEAPGPLVSVERQGETIVVRAQADVVATPAQTFATLADYDRLAEFIPDVALSRTVSRSGASVLVEQHGRATFGPFQQQFTLMLAIEEEPGAWISATAAGGDFKRFDARYELTSLSTTTTRIDYRAALEPTAGVPPFVGVPIMRGLIRRQFLAMIDEIGRRAIG
jgi:ribosome-associated toxin RatA of RatAB toxin-antitoxin module